MRCVIFDIDGTLADCEHRRHYLDHDNYLSGSNSAERWAKFFAGIPHDPPILPIVHLLLALKRDGNAIVLCTGRSVPANKTATEEWLARHRIPYDALYMRPEDCRRKDHIVKSELLDQILADGWVPWLVVDDRQSVVDMWRERGLTCLQCAKGDY